MKKFAIPLVAILAAACAEEGAGDPEAEAPEDRLMHDTLPDAATSPADTAAGLTVTLSEWTVRLARDTIPAPGAATTFRVRNNGEFEHILEVEGPGGAWATNTIAPGDWAALEADLRPGTYELYCPIDGEHGDHSDLGMVAHLVVGR